MPRRSLIDLLALHIAFERSGRAVPVAAQASPPPPPDPPADEPLGILTDADPDEPNRGKIEWVARPPAAAVGRAVSDYDPWSKERLK
jgi:hypothetical protein